MLRLAFHLTIRVGAGIALAIEAVHAARLGGAWVALAAALAVFALFAFAMAGVFLYLLWRREGTGDHS
jgi:uncharacterized iron-regulated membrane protein